MRPPKGAGRISFFMPGIHDPLRVLDAASGLLQTKLQIYVSVKVAFNFFLVLPAIIGAVR